MSSTVRNLRDATVTIYDSTGATPNAVEIILEDGGLTYTERKPVTVIKDRGVLSHARLADEEPVDLTISMKFISLSLHDTITPYDALTGTGGASAWDSDEPDSDVYAVILEISIDDPGGTTPEVLTFARFCVEEISFAEGDEYNTLTASGRAIITAPAVT